MKTIIINNEIELEIFLTLYENPKGVIRDFLVDKLNRPRTTIYDNLTKLLNRTINNIPYVKTYPKKTYKKGRPPIIFYIPKGIRNHYINFNLLNKK